MRWNEESIQVVKDVCAGKTDRFRASLKLGVNVRTIQRKVVQYRARGEECFVHGNKDRVPANKIDFDSITKFIVDNDMSGCNFSELCELLREYGRIVVSPSCVRKRFFAQNILSSKCRRKTRKKMRKILRELKKSEEMSRQKLQTLAALELEDVSGVWNHPTKPRSKHFGERLEMDASSHVWIKGLGTCNLHVCVDDASGFILALWLEREETLNGYYRLMEQILTNYGIPLKIRTDKRTVFIYNKKGASLPEKDTMTQFAYACHRLGVELACNSDPDFKPKVERANQTLQGILPYRFAMEGITTLDAANEYLQRAFIPYFNNRFGYDCDYVGGRRLTIGSVFDKCSADDIRDTLAVLCERTVNKGSSIQLDNAFMALIDAQGRRVALPYHTKLTVARLLDGSVFATLGDKCYALERIPERHAFSKDVDDDTLKPKERVCRPQVPQSHPWSYQMQMVFRQKDAMMKSLASAYKDPQKPRYA
jgi:hypothetical protein